MPVSVERILELLNADEPDYGAAAAEVGTDSFGALTTLVQNADPWIAARAASLVAVISADSAAAAAAVPVLAVAAGHVDPAVRAAAALGASRAGAAAVAVITTCLGDVDAGVRTMAFRGLSTPLDPAIAAAVENAAANDPEPGVRGKATVLAARNPDPALGNELLAGALDYAQARLAELRDAVLGSVASFADALHFGGFDDAGGVVANLLSSARAALDLVPPRMAVKDYSGAAVQIGIALRAVADAAAIVDPAGAAGDASFRTLLASEIAWAAVVPTGLAKQLGLPAAVPLLSVDRGALVYTITAPARQLMAAPLALGFDHAELVARLAMDGTSPPLSITLSLTGMEAGVGGGPIAKLLGRAGGSAHADVVFGVDTTRGLTAGGGAGPRVVLPARPKVGPIDLREISLELPEGVASTIAVGSTISTSIGGVIAATVDGSGVHVHIDPAAAINGNDPLSVSLKSPTGIGILLDTTLVRGGGFLGERPGGYGGALTLRLGPIEAKAFGLLRVDPSFALVVVISIGFLPPIDLTFGFTLNAVGGIVGVEHRIDVEAMRAGIGCGALDHILFPADPVAAAPAILSTLEQVFPVESGSVVIGPMIEIGWGRPVSFLTAQIGVLLSLPDPLVVIVGRGRIALPTPQLPIIDLRAVVYGEVMPDHLLIRASLNGSRIASFTVDGDIGFLVRWGGTPEMAISAGGFHPRYDPPHELSGMKRLAMDMSPPAILTLRSEAYFAVTTNTVQLGSRVEMSADVGIADISGHFAFDALILLSPRFAFALDANAGLTVHILGVTLFGVQLTLHLEGPAPFRVQGSAEVEVLWASKTISVGPFTWGDADNPPPALADPRQLARDAMHHNPGAWQALVPPGADRVVRLRAAPPSEIEVTVHPTGLFEVRQHAIPLETVITHVGANPVPEGQRRVHFGVPLVNETPAGALSAVNDLFSAGTYLDLTEDQKLSRPSFEPMLAGARIRPPGEAAAFDGARDATLEYETFVCDDDNLRGIRSRAVVGTLCASSVTTALAAGSAGRCDLRARTRYETEPDPIVLAHPGEMLVLSKVTLEAEAPAEWATYTHAAERVLEEGAQIARLGVA